METKICAQCGHEKPIEDFSKSYKNLCKACVAENERKKRLETKEIFSSARGLNAAEIAQPQFIPYPRFQAAMAAMQGILASGLYQTNSADFIAQKSVAYADALLNELNKSKDEDNK